MSNLNTSKHWNLKPAPLDTSPQNSTHLRFQQVSNSGRKYLISASQHTTISTTCDKSPLPAWVNKEGLRSRCARTLLILDTPNNETRLPTVLHHSGDRGSNSILSGGNSVTISSRKGEEQTSIRHFLNVSVLLSKALSSTVQFQIHSY